MLSLIGTYRGTDEEFIRVTRAGTADQLFRLTSLRREGDTLQFNGALLFDQGETLCENAARALREGFWSTILGTLTTKEVPVTLPTDNR